VAALAYQSIGYAGAAITHAAVGGSGDTITPDPRGFIWVKNGGGVSTTVTVTVPGTTQGQAHPDVAVAISAGAERMIGPLVDNLAAPETFGIIIIAYSATASVTIAAVTC
jgi:hypothetical protein